MRGFLPLLTFLLLAAGTAPAAERQGGPILLLASVSPAQVHGEEPAVYTLKLCRQNRVSDISLDLPEVEGLVFTKLGEPREYQDAVQGDVCQVLELRYAVLAQRPGIFRLAPARMGLIAYPPQDMTQRGPADDPFFSALSGKPQTLESEALELKALPLPLEGRPQDFSGLVGTFTIDAALEPRSVEAGEAAAFTARLSGHGNVQRIPDLKLPAPDMVRVYADQPVLKTEGGPGGPSGSKTMRWVLVPEQPGQYLLPSLAVSYFDSRTLRYHVLRTPSFTLSVLPGTREGTATLPPRAPRAGGEGTPDGEVRELGRDLLPVHATLAAGGIGSQAQGAVGWLLLFGPFAAYAAAWSGLRLRSRARALRPDDVSRKAAGKLLRRCRSGGLTADELHLALRRYVNERLGLALGSLTAAEGAGLLRARNVGHDVAERFRAALQQLEDAIYTGRGQEPVRNQDEIAALIARMEGELR